MYFILFVSQDLEKLEDILLAWDKAGASGITVLPSIGYAKIKEKNALREDFPLIPGLEDILETSQDQNRTLFTVVVSEEVKNEIIAATINITGDLNNPNTGILLVLPVSQAFGLNRIT
jgi:nitrogen regulatory protein PII